MVFERSQSQARLAHDLRPHVERVAGVFPLRVRKRRPLTRIQASPHRWSTTASRATLRWDAATDVPARPAEAQMDPRVANLQPFPRSHAHAASCVGAGIHGAGGAFRAASQCSWIMPLCTRSMSNELYL